jgi:hypothetical protein
MAEVRLSDFPPFDEAVPEIPDSAWIPDLWGFNSWVYIWQDFKERRRQRRAAKASGANAQDARTPSSSTSQKPSAT